MISTDCAIVLGIIALFQVFDLIQLKGIQRIVHDMRKNIKDIISDYEQNS